MTQKKNIIPGEIISKLLNIVVVAFGNVLVIIGESLIHYGKDNIEALHEKKENLFIESGKDEYDDLDYHI